MDTLLLDARCLPVDLIPWPRTMLHLTTARTKKHVRVVSEYADRVVHCTSGQIKLPAVIQLVPGRLDDGSWTDRVIKRRKSVRFSRQNIYSRDGGCCQYCGEPALRRSFSFDHVIPRSHGGTTCWENIVTACLECNQKKGGRTPVQARMRLLSTPKRPPQSGEHFFGFFEPWMPEEWRPWLPVARDVQASRIYWNGKLQP